MFVNNYALDSVKPAAYNPRQISEVSFERLKHSLDRLGVIKPIIVRKDNGIIIAGHQRTKAMKALGMVEAPAYLLSGVNKMDEVRFNQFHNGSDLSVNEKAAKVRITGELKPGYSFVKPDQIMVIDKGKLASQRHIIGQLILRYGSWGSSVVTQSGKVIVSGDYALVSKLLGKDLLIYTVPDEQEKDVNFFLSQDYGVYSYEHLPKDTFVQTLAQKVRLRGVGHNQSNLYKHIIPSLKKDQRILDFGSGWGDYARMLKGKGYNITDLEFYRRFQGNNAININWVNRRIDEIRADIEKNGLFDVVICDSVLNSVDSVEAEVSVMVTLNAFCKPGGIVWFSGRSRAFEEYLQYNHGSQRDARTRMYFLDKDGFTANYRYGRWFYQKVHSLKQINDLTKSYIGDNYMIWSINRQIDPYGDEKQLYVNPSFQVRAVKEKTMSLDVLEKGIKFEFSLPLPDGSRYNRGEEMFNLLKQFHNDYL